MEDFKIKKLAEIYRRGIKESVLVAEICDEVLDRSGGLLGEVREAAQQIVVADRLRNPPGCTCYRNDTLVYERCPIHGGG